MLTARRLAATALAVTLATALGACGSSSDSASTPTSTSTPATTPTTATVMGFEGVPLQQAPEIAAASSTTRGATVDGIVCGSREQLAYHIHAHLAVYDHGALRSLPAGIGIPGSVAQETQYGPIASGGTCIYWLHTHTPDGIIHIESPTKRIYTLGNFFDVWHQPLSATQVGLSSGTVTAFVDGKPWTRSPRDIPLGSHAVIQLDVGTASPPFQQVSFEGTQL